MLGSQYTLLQGTVRPILDQLCVLSPVSMCSTKQHVLDQHLGQHPTLSEVERSLVADFGQSLLPDAQGESSYL